MSPAMRPPTVFPRFEIANAEHESQNEVPTEPEDAIQERLQSAQDKIDVIGLILNYKNYYSDEERLRKIRVVVE